MAVSFARIRRSFRRFDGQPAALKGQIKGNNVVEKIVERRRVKSSFSLPTIVSAIGLDHALWKPSPNMNRFSKSDGTERHRFIAVKRKRCTFLARTYNGSHLESGCLWV